MQVIMSVRHYYNISSTPSTWRFSTVTDLYKKGMLRVNYVKESRSLNFQYFYSNNRLVKAIKTKVKS